MSTINDSDNFLVERSSTQYKTAASDLMSTINDTDLMIVERGGLQYKVTCDDVKSQLGDQELGPGDLDTSQPWSEFFILPSAGQTGNRNALGAWHPSHNINHIFNGYTDVPSDSTNWSADPGSGGAIWSSTSGLNTWELPQAVTNNINTFELSFTHTNNSTLQSAQIYLNDTDTSNGGVFLLNVNTADGLAGNSLGTLRYTQDEMPTGFQLEKVIIVPVNLSYSSPWSMTNKAFTWNYVKINGKVLADSSNFKPS
jgi:hypothetical protein